MFSLIKQVFIVLLSFSKSLERDRTECLYLNGKPCMISSTLIDLDPVELKYYPFMISLDKFSGSCNVLSPKTCVPKETKDINVKVFNINKNEAKIMARHISWIVNANSIVQHVIHIKNGTMKHVNVNVKIIISAKKIIVGLLAHAFVRKVSIQKVLLILQWLSVMKLYLLWIFYQQK